MHGVGLAIKTSLSRQLPELPTPVSERLMKLRFRLNPFRHVTVISAYAPTLTSSDEAKDAFYEKLNAVMKGVPPSDKLILLGDFSARVGTDCNNWKGVLGPHGTGKLNSNGLMLLSSVLRMTSQSPTDCSVRQMSTRQHGCTPDGNSGI